MHNHTDRCQRPRHDPLLGHVVDTIPGQSLSKPLGFIHIPKTGGAAIESQVNCPDLRCRWHAASAHFWHGLGMTSVAIIREPLSRFISAFEYARVGSEHFKVGFERYEKSQRGLPATWAREFRTLASFVDALIANETSSRHKSACALILRRDNGVLFASQAAWLTDTPDGSVHVLCYSTAIFEDLVRSLEPHSCHKPLASAAATTQCD